MTELSALAGSEGYAACDDDGGVLCLVCRAVYDEEGVEGRDLRHRAVGERERVLHALTGVVTIAVAGVAVDHKVAEQPRERARVLHRERDVGRGERNAGRDYLPGVPGP